MSKYCAGFEDLFLIDDFEIDHTRRAVHLAELMFPPHGAGVLSSGADVLSKELPPTPSQRRRSGMTGVFSSASQRIFRSEIREILKWTRKPGVISFGGGLPDPSLFPTAEIADITCNLLENRGYLALQYGPTQGEEEMLDALVTHMRDFGDEAVPEQVCVTSSSQQGLDLLGHLYVDEGSPVIMEIPSYLGSIQAYARHGADMRGIPLDDEGMDLDLMKAALADLAREGKKPRFIYVIPDFQNPSGITLSLRRREELLRIARDRDIPVIEDSPYRELSSTGETLPSLWTLAGGEGVIMMKTFSKVLFPGFRMGWLVGDTEVIEKIVLLKQSVDLCTSSFTQLILAEYIRRGKMRESIERSIECYRPKLAALLAALEKFMPDGVTWSRPTGGMFIWLTLPEHIDTRDIFMTAVEHNVAYVIGRPFHCDRSGGNTMRLNYSFPSEEQIEMGIKRLAEAIKEVL
jgi:2-aminoadipate transaminase